MVFPYPALIPFVIPDVPREVVTLEPQPDGHHRYEWQQDVDWIGPANQGGGSVPDDYEWTSNPRQEQERVSMG